MKPLVVIMGVSGSGKSLIGPLLADALEVPFADADDLHPQENVRKMAAGHPLTDDDRWPWLHRVGTAIAASGEADTGLVMACSALKRSYRDVIRSDAPAATFVLLEGPRELLWSRMSARDDHFMPPELLDSQLETLEPLSRDEGGVTVSVEDTPATIVAEIRSTLAQL